MKTIKQIADELGVSKQAVHKQASKLSSGMVSTSVNRSILVSEAGEAIIKANMTARRTEKPSTSDNYSLKILELEHQISLLKKERNIEKKNTAAKYDLYERELKAKDKQIEDSQITIREISAAMEQAVTALQTAQALHAGTLHNQKQLSGFTLEPDETDLPAGEQKASTEEPQNLSFLEKFKRLFQ